VVEGRVNEFASVTVAANGQGAQPATLRADPVAGGYRFSRTVPVNAGSNTVTIAATDLAVAPQATPLTTTQNWQFNVPAVSRTFSYDANGNTLSDGVRTMTWDAKNRLKTATKDGTTWKWDYDYQDRRVREYANNVLSKVFVWSGTEIVQERDAANAITRTHYFGGFSDGAPPASGTKYQTLTDHLGNIREVLTTAGTVAARYDYTPYQGPVKVGTSTVNPTFLTIGRYYHHEGSGLEFALYRAYDPALGRWLSRDPIKNPEMLTEGPNMFWYVGNNPINRFDPDGRKPKVPKCGSGEKQSSEEAMKMLTNWLRNLAGNGLQAAGADDSATIVSPPEITDPTDWLDIIPKCGYGIACVKIAAAHKKCLSDHVFDGDFTPCEQMDKARQVVCRAASGM
jgi:RHS repeat-associated protein